MAQGGGVGLLPSEVGEGCRWPRCWDDAGSLRSDRLTTGNIVLEGATLDHADFTGATLTATTDIAANNVAMVNAKFGDSCG